MEQQVPGVAQVALLGADRDRAVVVFADGDPESLATQRLDDPVSGGAVRQLSVLR